MTVIVLAMHGVPPRDFPSAETREFFALQGAVGHGHGHGHGHDHAGDYHPGGEDPRIARYAALQDRMLNWPRTESNDPFFFGSQALAEELASATGHPVIVGFNEFCAPDMAAALDRAAGLNADPIVVITPMMTRGGDHSEADIPGAIEKARSRHPGRRFVYAWPFEVTSVARFLASQVERHIDRV